MTIPTPVRLLGELIANALAIGIGGGLGWCLFALYEKVNGVLGIIVGIAVLAWLRILVGRYRFEGRKERADLDRAWHSWMMSPLGPENAGVPGYVYELRDRAHRFEFLTGCLACCYVGVVAGIVTNVFLNIHDPWWIGLLLGLAAGIVSLWARQAPPQGVIFPGR
ncbi:hypothetical protein [Amycolatopsis sp. GM8]|uniref:hypothetical protein n=1 Tax=Amycolatopsis sp. GM8 TaxID=2896530 RepID=UPI001F159068|nr:hypothetical protein [Amycolatopsis sp. GM8]